MIYSLLAHFYCNAGRIYRTLSSTLPNICGEWLSSRFSVSRLWHDWSSFLFNCRFLISPFTSGGKHDGEWWHHSAAFLVFVSSFSLYNAFVMEALIFLSFTLLKWVFCLVHFRLSPCSPFFPLFIGVLGLIGYSSVCYMSGPFNPSFFLKRWQSWQTLAKSRCYTQKRLHDITQSCRRFHTNSKSFYLCSGDFISLHIE